MLERPLRLSNVQVSRRFFDISNIKLYPLQVGQGSSSPGSPVGRLILQCELCLSLLFTALTIDSNHHDSALTDALISGIANGSTAYRLVGSYVSTPLNW